MLKLISTTGLAVLLACACQHIEKAANRNTFSITAKAVYFLFSFAFLPVNGSTYSSNES